MKKIALYFHGGSYNHGCEAIVRSTVAMLKAEFPDSFITLYSTATKEDKEFCLPGIDRFVQFNHMSTAINPTFFEKLKLKALSLTNQKKADFYYYHLACCDDSVKDNDIFLSIGGDNYCYSNYKQYAAQNYYIRSLKKKTVLWGCSVGKEDLNPEKTEDIKGYDAIFARETITYQNMLDIGVPKEKLFLYPDPAFTLKTEFLPLPKGFVEGKTVGINLSPMVINLEKEKGIALEATEKLVEYILKETDSNIAFIPHVTKDGGNDLEPLTELYNKYKDTDRVVLIDEKLNAEQIKGYIARCEAFVGARTHSTIAAYSSCVPTLVLGYSVKSIGIARDIFSSEEGMTVPIKNLTDSDQLKDAFKKIYENKDFYRKKLESVMPEYKKASFDAAKKLSEVL